MYAQKIEGDSWLGEKLDGGKIDKMSGTDLGFCLPLSEEYSNTLYRPAAWTALRAHASHSEKGARRQ